MARSAAVTGAGTATARRTTTTRGTSTSTKGGSSGGRGGKGFGAWKKASKESGGGDINQFSVEEDTKYVIAFMEDGPFAVVWVHWCPGVTDSGRPTNVPRNCPTTTDENAECPLCEMGIEAKPVAYFNVVDLDEPNKVYCWQASRDPAGRVEKLYDELQEVPESRGGPLELNSPGVYALVAKEKQKNGFFAYSVQRKKAHDLEDFDLQEIPDEQFEALESKLYTDSIIKYKTTEELREFAATLED